MRELELKARVTDPDATRRRLLEAGATPGYRGMMRDRRYDRDGELERRDEVLRVRTYDRTPPRSILAWKGPTGRSPEGYKLRQELEYEVAGAQPPAALLAALGYQVSHAIDRYVEYLALGRASARIEWYPAMDVLLEVEGNAPDIERMIVASGIPRGEFLPDSLTEFVARYERRSGQAAVLADPGFAGTEPARPRP